MGNRSSHANLSFGVGVLDAAVLSAAAGVMLVVVLTAMLLPARRATLVDPIEVLRAE